MPCLVRYRNKFYCKIGPLEIQYGRISKTIIIWWHQGTSHLIWPTRRRWLGRRGE